MVYHDAKSWFTMIQNHGKPLVIIPNGKETFVILK